MARLALPVSVTQPDALPIGPGAVLNGRYQVLQRHKAGPHGLNLVALDKERSRRVVVKVLVPLASGRPSDPFGLTRLADALDRTRGLSHRGSAKLLNTFTETVAGAPSLCLVTDRQSQPNLTTLLAQVGSFDAYRACAILDAIADVLENAHEEGLLHLGLKPNNIFLDRVAGTSTAASVLVADLGLVDAIRQAAPAWPLNLDQQYTAPEVIDAEPADVRADVYSLGAILKALLGGESSETAPLRLMEVAQRAMANHPMNRPESVAAFRESVHEALVATVSGPQAFPTIQDDTIQPDEPKRVRTPSPAPPPPRERLPSKSGRRLMWGSVALAAAGVAIVGTMVLGPPWVREYRAWASQIGMASMIAEAPRAVPGQDAPPVIKPIAPPVEVAAVEPAPVAEPVAKKTQSRRKANTRTQRTQPRVRSQAKRTATATPPAKPAAVSRTVMVTSSPSNAVVFKGKNILGNTPLEVELVNGDPTALTVWLPAHPTKSITVDGSEKTVAVTLDRSAGTSSTDATPAP